jgi:hypothetical protein
MSEIINGKIVVSLVLTFITIPKASGYIAGVILCLTTTTMVVDFHTTILTTANSGTTTQVV